MKKALLISMVLLMSAPVFANEAVPTFDAQEEEFTVSDEANLEEGNLEEAARDDIIARGRFICYSRPYGRRGPIFRGIHFLRNQAARNSLRSCYMRTVTRCVLVACRRIN